MTNKKQTRRRQAQAGFTLLEILIAIALLAAIAGLLVTNLDRILGGGREEVARLFVEETLETPLTAYRVNMGRYPTTEEGLKALEVQPSDEAINWRGPYVKKMNPDPWGNPYQYACPAERSSGGYDIWSFGPDGQESDDDIGNWGRGTGVEE